MNDVGSTLDLARIDLHLSKSSFEVPLYWASAQERAADGSPATGDTAISGLGPSSLTMEGAWAPAESLRLRAFPNDFGDLPAIPMRSMLGVEATAPTPCNRLRRRRLRPGHRRRPIRCSSVTATPC